MTRPQLPVLDAGARPPRDADPYPLDGDGQAVVLDGADVERGHVHPPGVRELAALEQRPQAVRRELRGPVVALVLGQVVVEELARGYGDLREARLPVGAPRRGRPAEEGVHEGEPRDREAGGDEYEADDVAGSRIRRFVSRPSETLDGAVADQATV